LLGHSIRKYLPNFKNSFALIVDEWHYNTIAKHYSVLHRQYLKFSLI
jgi:hypothetical protein